MTYNFFSSKSWLLFSCLILLSAVTQAQNKKAKSDGLFKMLRHAAHFNMEEAEEYNLKEVDRIMQQRDLYKPRKFPIVLSRPYFFLSSIYYKKGDFKQAEFYYNKLDSLANIHSSVAFMRDAALDERSRLMIEMGDHTEAKRIIQSNINRYENLPDKRLISCNAYSTYAIYYQTHGQYDSSVYYFKKYILQMHNNWFLPFVNDMANSYTQLADVAARNNELKDALDYAKKGYRINSHRWARKNNNAVNHYDRIASANTVAEVYRLSGNVKKAISWNSKANRMYAARPTRIAQYELPLLTTRALTYWSIGKLDSAQRCFNSATATYFDHVNENFTYLSEFERVYFYNHTRYFMEYAKSFYFEQAKEKKPMSGQKLFELSINTKGLLFNSSLKFVDKVSMSSDTTIINNYRKLKELKNQISTISLAQESATSSGDLQLLDSQMKVLERGLMDKLGIEKEKFTTSAEILNNIPNEYQLVDVVKCQVISRKKSAKGKVAVLQLSDTSAYVYFVSSPDRKEFAIDYSLNGNKLETSLYTAYRNSVRFDLRESLLYTEYFKKIEDLLSTKRVLYSADGIYNLINPNVLFDGNGYLIDRFDFKCLVSSKEVLREKEEDTDLKSIAFFGRPDFSGHSNSDNKNGYTDLPGTEEEIKAIQSILPAHVLHRSYMGVDANESLIKGITPTSVLHFATHGYFNESQYRNPLLNSGLVLSRQPINEEEVGSEEDGLLTAYEASTLNLSNTSLVILSACETGLGTTVDGDGVWGLQRAFQSAGVNYIIMSLFKVNDAITAQLMTVFYQNLVKEQSINDAFKNAESIIKEKYPQPIHWGAFILKGY